LTDRDTREAGDDFGGQLRGGETGITAKRAILIKNCNGKFHDQKKRMAEKDAQRDPRLSRGRAAGRVWGNYTDPDETPPPGQRTGITKVGVRRNLPCVVPYIRDGLDAGGSKEGKNIWGRRGNLQRRRAYSNMLSKRQTRGGK